MSNKSPLFSLVALIIISSLGCCMELDISIPSFPSIMTFFGATEAEVQSTLSLNFLAFCLSGLFYGPLSEAWGRRGLMLFGATCFLIGALGCVFSFSIYQLMFWRFIQGLGASSAFVLGVAMLADAYSGDAMTRNIGKMNAYITVFMAGAPILGSMIINYFTWRANFTFIAIIALLAWGCLVFALPETRFERKPVNFLEIVKDYTQLVTQKEFMLLAAIPNMLVSAYLTFVGSAAFYYINTSSLSYFQFAAHQGLIVITFSLTSFYAGKVVNWLGPKKAVNIGLLQTTISAMLLMLFAYGWPDEPILITMAMCLFAMGCAFPMSVTVAQSLEVVPDLKGTSASFIMSSRLLLSSAAIALTGVFFDGSMRPVAWVNGVLVIAALLMYFMMNQEKNVIAQES